MADFLEQLKRSQAAKESKYEQALKDGDENATKHLSRYEAMREGVPDQEVWADWRDGDRWHRGLTEDYQRIRSDETLSPEGRSQKEQQAYDTAMARAAKGWERARQRAAMLAKENEARAIPMPRNMTLQTSTIQDASTMLAIQAEAERIAQKVSGTGLAALTKERAHAGGNSGVKASDDGGHTGDTLRKEFNEAMEVGGVEGEIRAHAVLKAAEAMGVASDEVAAKHMGDKHLTAAENAYLYSQYAQTIPTEHQLPKPTPPPRKADAEVGTYGQGKNKFMVGGKAPTAKARRRPAWK